MKLSVLDESSGSIYSFDVDAAETLDSLRALIEVDARVPLAQQSLSHNGKALIDDRATLQSLHIGEDDLIYLRRKPKSSAAPAAAVAPSSSSSSLYRQQQQPRDLVDMNPQQLLQHFQNPVLLEQIRAANPSLYQLIQNGNAETLARALAPLIAQQKAQRREEELYRRIAENPFDVEAQREIENMIQQKQVEENYLNAMEHSPESFAQVIMLYIDATVNGVPLKAFIDSGAQMSIMSKKCAERCNLLRLMDRQFSGIARGVGSAKILGRIHLTTMVIGQSHFPITITVLDQDGMDFLLGLDMLKRHQCQIDLKDNVLRIGPEAARFLGEGELKEQLAREHAAAVDPSSPLSPKFTPFPAASTIAGSSGSGSGTTTTAVPPSPARSSPAPTTTSAPTTAASGQLPSFITEDKIQQIVALGFARQQAIQALASTGGNVDMAASMLF